MRVRLAFSAGCVRWSQAGLAELVEVVSVWRRQHAYQLALCTPGLRNWARYEGG